MPKHVHYSVCSTLDMSMKLPHIINSICVNHKLHPLLSRNHDTVKKCPLVLF